MINIEENKERFILLLSANVHKTQHMSDIDAIPFIDYLSESDFFIAPASSNYHGNYVGGLCEHSLSVYDNLLRIYDVYRNADSNYSLFYTTKTLTLVSLLHDICKIGIYQASYRNVKQTDKDGKEILNKKGLPVWEKQAYYMIEDSYPLGHGEKSVIILQRYYALSTQEIMAIRWHMGGYDDLTKTYVGNITANKAFNTYPLITLLHMADLASIFLSLKDVEDNTNYFEVKSEEDLGFC